MLPLPTPLGEFTHGLYCDEFAEFQTKDIPVRQRLGGFLPSNGVGPGSSAPPWTTWRHRAAGRMFDPDCLTEDYENGLSAARAGLPPDFSAGAVSRRRARWRRASIFRGVSGPPCGSAAAG